MEALVYDSSLPRQLREDPECAAPVVPLAFNSTERLATRRCELQAQLSALAQDEGDSARPRFSNHLAEDAQDQQHFQGLVAQRTMLLSELHQVEHALRRIATRTYGLCEDCGRQIPPRRLEVLPTATLCVPCQSQRESRRVVY